MNYYQLDTKTQDADFINGTPVFCPAALTEAEIKAGKLAEGSKIVVRLSSGAKYMGKVLRFDSKQTKGTVAGIVEIRREPLVETGKGNR